MLTTDRYQRAAHVEALYTRVPFPRPFILDDDYEAARRSPSQADALRMRIAETADRTRATFLRQMAFDFRPYGRGAGLKILDAGCGTGNKAVFLSLFFPEAQVVAFDFNEASLKHLRYAKEIVGLANLTVMEADLTNDLPFSEEFDHIFSLGVLHHLPDPEAGLSRLVSLLEPSGLITLYLYDHWGRTPVILFNRFVVHLADNRPDDMDRIMRKFRLNTKTPGWFEDPVLELIDQEGRRPTGGLQDLVPPILFRALRRWRRGSDYPLYNNWDLCANPLVHLYDVDSIYGIAERAGLQVVSLRFRSGIKVDDPRDFLKETLRQRDLANLESRIDTMTDREVYVLTECLLRPNAFNINLRR